MKDDTDTQWMIIFTFSFHAVILLQTYKWSAVCPLNRHQVFYILCMLENTESGEVTPYFPFSVKNDISLPRDPCLNLEFVFEFNRILSSSVNTLSFLIQPECKLMPDHWWILQGLISLSQSTTNWTTPGAAESMNWAQISRLDLRKKVFTMEIVKPWPRSPSEVVDAPSLKTFKVKLNRALRILIYLKTYPPHFRGAGLDEFLKVPSVLNYSMFQLRDRYFSGLSCLEFSIMV